MRKTRVNTLQQRSPPDHIGWYGLHITCSKPFERKPHSWKWFIIFLLYWTLVFALYMVVFIFFSFSTFTVYSLELQFWFIFNMQGCSHQMTRMNWGVDSQVVANVMLYKKLFFLHLFYNKVSQSRQVKHIYIFCLKRPSLA